MNYAILTAPEARSWFVRAQMNIRELTKQVLIPSPGITSRQFDEIREALTALAGTAEHAQCLLDRIQTLEQGEPVDA